jgi:MFS transporter, DHA2 family, methylenomycin A resistance protein
VTRNLPPSDHEPRTAAELGEGVDPSAMEGLVDEAELSSENGLPNSPHARIVITIASMGFFLITLDIGIVNVALARIKADLGGGTTGQQWIIDAYTLLFASLLLFAGNLSDRIGAKRALGLGIAIFTLTSVACAMAPTAGLLIAARAAQGAGAAIMLPASMALVREGFPDPGRRARALGVWAVGGAVAGLVAQPVGGLLTTYDWRLVFTINLPVGLAMLVFLRWVGTSPKRPQPFDCAGQVLAVAGLAGLVYGLIEGGHAGFDSPPALIALGTALVALIAFVMTQARVRHPMMPLNLFHAHGFRIALPVGFAFMIGNFGNVFVVALYLQQHLVPVVAGLLSMVVGLTALLVVAPLGHPWLMALCVIPMGAGGSLAMPSVTSVVLEGVAAHQAGTASAVFNTFRQVGGAVAIAVFGGLIANPATIDQGLRLSLGIAAFLILLAALNSLRIRPRRSRGLNAATRSSCRSRNAIVT